MSSFSRANASTVNNPFVAQTELFDSLYRMCELFAVLPFIAIAGKLRQVAMTTIQINDIMYNTYNSTGDRGVRAMDPGADPGTTITAGDDGKVKNAYALTTTRTHYLKRFLGRVEINRALMDNFSSDNPLVRQQIELKRRALRYQYCDTLFNGTGTTEAARDFQGIDSIIASMPATQRRTGTLTGGVANVDTDLDALVYTIQAANGRCDFIVMNPVMYALYCRLMTIKGVTIPTAWCPQLGRRVPLHQGIVPIYRSRFVTIGTTEPVDDITPIATKVYAGTLGANDGLCGMYQAGLGDGGLVVRDMGPNSDADKYEGEVSLCAGASVVGDNSMGYLDYTAAAVTLIPLPIST